MSTVQPRKAPQLYALLLSTKEHPELMEAREQLNPYKRISLRQAWIAGWHAWRLRVRLGEGWTSPLMSSLGRAAFRRGWHDRQQFEQDYPTEETQ